MLARRASLVSLHLPSPWPNLHHDHWPPCCVNYPLSEQLYLDHKGGLSIRISISDTEQRHWTGRIWSPNVSSGSPDLKDRLLTAARPRPWSCPRATIDNIFRTSRVIYSSPGRLDLLSNKTSWTVILLSYQYLLPLMVSSSSLWLGADQLSLKFHLMATKASQINILPSAFPSLPLGGLGACRGSPELLLSFCGALVVTSNKKIRLEDWPCRLLNINILH